ncbi:MAG: Rne/Rng family ribonuclease [Alphaproteobacteria bacterium]|nr:Rne/Rng family ribonuclease [Alphaproteobacteria bacterium]
MKRMLIDDTQPEETRVVIVDGNKIEDVEFESSFRKQIKGNIFSAKVIRIEPSLQACFIDYGGNRHGFLAFGEIHPDYYNVSDEVKQEVEKEVEEIIERKRQYQLDRQAERERRRLEREQKRAEYEARMKAEAEALENAQNTEDCENGELNSSNDIKTSDCGCGADCQCRKEDGICRCAEKGVCECSCEDNCNQEAHDNNCCCHEEHSEEACSFGKCDCCYDKHLDNEETVPLDEEQEEVVSTEVKEFSDEEEGSSDEQSSLEEGDEEKSQKKGRRRGTRFLGRRGNSSKGKYKVSLEASGIRDDSIAEDISSSCDDFDDDDDSKLYDNDNDCEDDEICEAEDTERYLEIQRKLIYARKLYHRSTIQDVIKEGQTVLVQVVKEERGNKGAACTTYLSLAGRYCVLMPNRIKSGGVSRKITNANDRKRLKDLIKELPLNDDMSMIIRTAGEDKKREDIIRDYNYLIRTWNHIRHSALSMKVPSIIYEEGNLIKRALRDMYTKDIGEVIIDGDEAYRMAKDFSKILSPNMSRKIKCRKANEIPVFQHYQVEKELDKLHNPIVQLASGGYLVINPTEALVAIDVNSGRATHEMDIEETALKTNLEAADEIARQLKLRNLAGLIVVDFIDMDEAANNHAVEKRMKEALKTDRSRVQVAKMSIFGLLEISRQRMHSSFVESNYTTCPYCKGQGVQRTTESGANLILRALEEEGIKKVYNHLEAKLPSDTAIYILNHKRRILADLEERYNIEIVVSADSSIRNISDYKIERTKVTKEVKETVAATSAYEHATQRNDASDDEEEEIETIETNNSEEGNDERRHRQRRRFDRRGKSRMRGRKGNRDNYKNDNFSENRENVHSLETNASQKVEQEPKEEKKTWWKKLIG